MTNHFVHTPSASGRRKCRKCGQEKEVAEFRPDKRAKNGRHYPRHHCRVCENKAWRHDWLAGKKGRQKAAVLSVNLSPVVVPQKGQSIKAQLEESIRHRMTCYQCDALDALHDLAMMPISATNSMLNQIKLAAAKLLAGPLLSPEATGGSGELEKTLRELNVAYHKGAPRIKAIRERIVTFGEEPSPDN